MEQASGLDAFRENLRLQQVYSVFLRYGLDIALDRPGFLGSLRQGMQAWVWNLPKDLEIPELPTKIRLMMEELGPTYVKIGQIVSSQASTLPSEWQIELEKLQSNVPPFGEDQVRQILMEELKGAPEDLFAEFSLKPLAAASTAQVHRAVLHDGTEVVVKLQRPGIRKQMKADIGILSNASRVFSRRIKSMQAFDLAGMVDEFGSNALLELNYVGEAYNAMRLAENLAGCPGVHICKTFPEYSTSRVLTMEFVRGVKISNLEAIDAAGIDRQVLATNTLRAMVKMLMIDGFFHADPHPGNILVNTTTGDVTFIDTGMVGEITVTQRLNFVQLLMALQNRDVNASAAVLKSLSVPFQEQIDEGAYYKDFQRSLGPYMMGAGSMDFAQSLNTGMDVLRRNGLRLDPNLTLAVKALMQAQAITGLLFPGGGLLEQGVQVAQAEALKLVTPDNVNKVAKQALGMVARQVSENLPSLSEATLGWLTQYKKGRFEVYVDTSAISKEVAILSKFGRLAVIALVLVGLVIGSAIVTAGIAIGSMEGAFWGIIIRIAVIGYVFASLAAMLIVLRLIWRWFRRSDPRQD
ncbi:MAG: ABC1 kinase family protein [Nitrososphaerales archaeon]